MSPLGQGDAVLTDSFGRIATDLRVSLTDRCNLRCGYCMPPEGLDWLPGPALLTDDEIIRLIAIAVHQLGVTEVRFTGGEPLLRRGLATIVARTAALRPRPEMSVTTNGIGLVRLAGTLHDAGRAAVPAARHRRRPPGRVAGCVARPGPRRSCDEFPARWPSQ
jgi:molybdenum cofactor biosynthesis enzyme MoaA